MTWFILRCRSTKERDSCRALNARGIRAVFAGKRVQHRTGGVNASINKHEIYVEFGFSGYIWADLPTALGGHEIDWSAVGWSIGDGAVPNVQEVLGWRSGIRNCSFRASRIEPYLRRETRPCGDVEEVFFISAKERPNVAAFIAGQRVSVIGEPFNGFEGEVITSTPQTTEIANAFVRRLTVSTDRLRAC